MTDPLMDSSPADLHWSTANVGEAMPNVLTPLCWTLWGPSADTAIRTAWGDLGALDPAEVTSEEHRMLRIFHGRAALLLEAFGMLGDRLPGATSEQVVLGLFGEVSPTLASRPTRKRYPRMAVALPRHTATIARRLQATAVETERWWQASVRRVPELDLESSVALFEDARKRFVYGIRLQTFAAFCRVQPGLQVLETLTQRAGVGDATALAGGYGNVPETGVVFDLWRASREEIPLSEVVRLHGFHGPSEGELSSRVWRDDSSPLQRLLDDYAARPDDADPRVRDTERQAQREQGEREVVAALPASARPAARAALGWAAAGIPLRGVAKGAFLQAFDAARASARRVGEILTTTGTLTDPGDIFFLTVPELLEQGGQPTAFRASAARNSRVNPPHFIRRSNERRWVDPVLPRSGSAERVGLTPLFQVVEARRAQRAEHESVRLPEHWRGAPVPLAPGDAGFNSDVTLLEGTGVSAGTVEGLVRVVLDPATAQVEPDEILVAPTTDPSWSSVMFISSALVVDIGGVMSHAAIVARELGIPCVVNTLHGSRALCTGDRVRVDGSSGRVEVLSRAATDRCSPGPT